MLPLLVQHNLCDQGRVATGDGNEPSPNDGCLNFAQLKALPSDLDLYVSDTLIECLLNPSLE